MKKYVGTGQVVRGAMVHLVALEHVPTSLLTPKISLVSQVVANDVPHLPSFPAAKWKINYIAVYN
jgi:hypothetical protein